MNKYAPLYTGREKCAILLRYFLWLIPIGMLYFWVVPWWQTTTWFLCHPHGYEVLIKGSIVAVLGILFLSLLFQLPENLKIIRLKQYPLPEQKTFRLTRYQYGFPATWRSYAQVAMLAVIAAAGLFTFPLADKVIQRIDPVKLQLEQRAAQCPN